LGLKVSQREVRDKMGLAEPAPDDEILAVSAQAAPAVTSTAGAIDPNSKIKRVPGEIKRGQPLSPTLAALQAQDPVAARLSSGAEMDPVALLADQLQIEAAPAMAGMIGQIEAMLAAAGSMEEFRAMLLAGFPKLDATALAGAIAGAMMVADAAGRVAVEDGVG
jgi:phage gp29-like protein